MALREIADIKKAVKESQGRLRELRDRFESDYGLRRLEKYDRGKGYESITRNDPRTLADKIISLLSSAERKIRIPLELDSEEERKAKSNAERFIYGSFNLIDSRFQSFIQPSIQDQLSFFAPIRGWFAIRAYIRKGADGEVIPDVAIWDIFNTDWDIGSKGVGWVCHQRKATASQIKAEHNVDIKGKSGTVYDFWDDEIYAVFIEDKFVINPTPHKLGHLPVGVFAVGSVPFIQSEKFADKTLTDVGESIFAANRGIYQPLNEIISDYKTIISLGVHTPLTATSKDGKPFIPESPYYKGNVINLSTNKEQSVGTLFTPVMPKDAEVLWSALDRMSTIGGLSPLAYGLLERDVSGYGISLLHHASESILLAPRMAMERAMEWLARELLTQYSGSKFGKLKLHGRDGTNEAFDIELKPKDIKGDWFPEVELKASLPEDEAARWAMMQIAIQNEIYSTQTAMDRMGVRDTDAEDQKIMRKKAMSMPPILLRSMAAAFKSEGRPDLAQIFLDEIERLESKAKMSDWEAKRAEATSEAVEPQFATGIPRNVLPSEELGKRPRTPEEISVSEAGWG